MLNRFSCFSESVLDVFAKGVLSSKHSIPLTLKGSTKQVDLEDAKAVVAFFDILDDKSKVQFTKEIESGFAGFYAVLDFAKNFMRVRHK